MKKKITKIKLMAALAAVMFCGTTVFGQVYKASTSSNNYITKWKTTSGGDSINNSIIYENAAKIGIGTTSPGSKLDVAGDINISSGSKILYNSTTLFQKDGTNNGIYLGTGNLSGSLTGDENTFIGDSAGASNTDGEKNVFIGYKSGKKNTGGDRNVFIGPNSGAKNTTGTANFFLGNSSGITNTTGGSNVFIGDYAGYYNNSSNNTFIGEAAGQYTTTGEDNTFIGYRSGKSNATGTRSTYIGKSAGENSTAGSNTFMGYKSGVTNTSGAGNTFIGTQSGYYNLTSNYNTAIGYQAGYTNSTGASNVFLGSQAGYSETGSDKLYIDNSNTSTPLIYGDFSKDSLVVNGEFRVHIDSYDDGVTMGHSNNSATGDYSMAFGYKDTASGISSIAMGYESEASGTYSVAMGYRTTASNSYSLAMVNGSVASGGSAVAIGANDSATGANSIAMGYYCKASGSTSVAIGNGAKATNTDAIAIGQGIEASGLNTIAIALNNQSGTNVSDQNTMAIMGGEVGIGTISPGYKLQVNDDVAGVVAKFFNDGDNANRGGIVIQGGKDDGTGNTVYIDCFDGDYTEVGYIANNSGTFQLVDVSDKRTKREINDTKLEGLDIIKKLRVVDFKRLSKSNNTVHHGFIAQEVQEVFPYMVSVNENGMLGISKEQLVPVLVKAMQEQSGVIEQVKAETKEQKAEIETQNAKIQALESQLALLQTELSGLRNCVDCKGNNATGLENNLDGAKLFQNNPNPFTKQTEIGYYLPNNTVNANIIVFDMTGKQMKSYTLASTGNGKLVINGGELEAGMYLYSLVADGKEIDTKRMILTNN